LEEDLYEEMSAPMRRICLGRYDSSLAKGGLFRGVFGGQLPHAENHQEFQSHH
jgi:hypothetical protein